MEPYHYLNSNVRDALSDPERLRVIGLPGLLDVEPEGHADRWAQVAAEALDAPVAMLTILDRDQQLFKSTHGLGGWMATQRGLPLTHSICQHVVAAQRPLAVQDARIQAGLADNLAVVELGVVAYAGVPIIVSGQAVGALCVVEPHPRDWTTPELRLLDKLAQGVAYEMQLRIAAEEIAHSSLLVEAHNRIHELIADDQPLARILEAIVESIEVHDPALRGSIHLLDVEHATLHNAAAPRLPATYLEALDGVRIGPGVGSCGTAAWSGEEVITVDIGLDERWAEFRHLVAPLGLRHCWSFPITDGEAGVLGTFGVYGDHPREPREQDRRFLRNAAKLAGIAIERRQTHDRLVYDATHDALTGLNNRAAAFEQLDEMLAEAGHGDRVAVLFVDLDRLKAINDLLGHDVGDQVIREAGTRLRGCAARGDLVARLGGEEFVIATRRPETGAIALAQDVLTALEAPVADLTAEGEIAVTASVGVALGLGEHIDARRAVRRADAAMYEAKSRGGNQYAIRDRSGAEPPTRRLLLENALRHAIERDQLSVVYQPVQRFRDGSRGAVEALVRWRHPDLGDVEPDEFIPVAERSGLIGEIGAWVLCRACGDVAALSAAYGTEVQVGVNVAAQQLRDPGFRLLVADTLAAHGLGAHRLFVEITETGLLGSDATTAETVEALSAMGVHIALDDFGTGYSSLAVLKRYPVSAIKIDRSFTAGLPDDHDDLAIVTALTRMAQSLGLGTIAEGIETVEQYELLAALGCDFAQGFLVGRPVPLDALGSVVAPVGSRAA